MLTSEESVTMVTSEEVVIKDDAVPSCNTKNKDTGSSTVKQAPLNVAVEEEVEVIIVEAPEQLTIIPPSPEPLIILTMDNHEPAELVEEGQAVIVESSGDEQKVTQCTPQALPIDNDDTCQPLVPVKEETSQHEFRKRLRSHSSSDGSDPSVKRTKLVPQDSHVNDDNNNVTESVSER